MPTDLPLWRRPRAQLVALAALLWALGAGLLALAWSGLLPFVLAALAAYVIDPLIVRLTALRPFGRPLPRWAAVLVVYLGVAGLTWIAAVSVAPQVYREALRGLLAAREQLAGATPERIHAWARAIDAFLERAGIPLDVDPGDGTGAVRLQVDLAAGIAQALAAASAWLRASVGDVVAFTQAVLAGTLRGLLFAVLLFMLTAYISMDAPRILAFSETVVPSAWREDLRRLRHGIDAGLAGVVRGQVTIMVVNAALTLVGLLVLKVPLAFALTALVFVLSIVPIFGTVLSSVPIVLLALLDGLPKGLAALAWILGVHALESYVLNPKIMGEAARIHPVLVVLALVIGERTSGLTGALLAVPLMSVFVAVFRFLHRKLAVLDERASGTAPIVEARPAPTKGSAP
ncbi:MAG TPA: AI-2E family transporter [Anaeromyxobacteraceae bacterium]|nr:AI-2E family transporter [Anaeromyxobacteraceae bacterium]